MEKFKSIVVTVGGKIQFWFYDANLRHIYTWYSFSIYYKEFKKSLANIKSSNFFKDKPKIKFVINSLIYFLFLVLFSVFIFPFIDNYNFQVSHASSFFTSVGSVSITVIALTFSIRNFLIQNIANKTSAKLYKIVSEEQGLSTSCTFFFTALGSFLAFCLAILFGNDSRDCFIYKEINYINDSICVLPKELYTLTSKILPSTYADLIIQASIICLGIMFYLLFLLYFQTFEIIDPYRAILLIRERGIKTLKKLRIGSLSIAKARLLDPREKNKPTMQNSIEIYANEEFTKISAKEIISKYLDYLFDNYDKLISQNEKSLAKATTDSIKDIFIEFLNLRKEATFIDDNKIDYESFAELLVEKFINRIENCLENKDNELARVWVNNLKNIAVLSSETRYLKRLQIDGSSSVDALDTLYSSGRREFTPNYINISGVFGIFLWWLNEFSSKAIEKKSLDMIAFFPQIYKELIAVAINKDFNQEVQDICSVYFNLLNYAIENKNILIWRIVTKSLFQVQERICSLEIMMKQETIFETINASVDEHIIHSLYAIKNGDLENEIDVIPLLETPLNTKVQAFENIAKSIDGENNVDKRITLINHALEFQDSLFATIARITVTMENINTPLARIIGEALLSMGDSMLELTINEKWRGHMDPLVGRVSQAITSTTGFLNYNQEIANDHSCLFLIEAAAYLGMKSLIVYQEPVCYGELILDSRASGLRSIETLNRFAGYFIKLNSDSTRAHSYLVVRYLAYIGILANKKNISNIFEKVKESIFEVETNLKAITPPEHIGKIRQIIKYQMIELINMQSQISHEVDLTPSTRLLLENIQINDINKFVEKVWGEE